MSLKPSYFIGKGSFNITFTDSSLEKGSFNIAFTDSALEKGSFNIAFPVSFAVGFVLKV